jgi:hypothetical protein
VGNPKAFARVLTKAVYRIATEEQKRIRVVHDELGYALGREETAGSAIEYWRKGYIPANPGDVEQLARELYWRGGLPDRRALDDFLRYTDYPQRTAFCDEVLAAGAAGGMSGSPAAPPSAWASSNPAHALITLTIEGNLPEFTPDQRERLITAIAIAAAIDPERIRVVRMIPGSIRLTIELPDDAARQLIATYTTSGITYDQGQINAMMLEHELPAQHIQQIAAATVRGLVYLEHLDALDLIPDDPALEELRRSALAGLDEYDDPLLPASGFTLDDPAQRTALQAYLEVRLERDPRLLARLEELLQAPTLHWSQHQQIAALVSLVARTTYRELDRVPGALIPALRHFLRHLRDPWRAELPPRWWRWLPFGLRGAAEQRRMDRDARYVQMIHAAVVTLLQMDPHEQQAALADPDTRRLQQQATDVARRIQLPTNEHPAVVAAYVHAIQQASELFSDDLDDQA